MKKIFLTSCAFLLLSFKSQAQQPDFKFEPAITAEYSALRISGNSSSKHLATDDFDKQLKEIDNFALGFHARLHPFLGINLNWAQTDMDTPALQGYSLTRKADFALNQYNLSALFFAPKNQGDIIEAFLEAGLSNMKSKISIFETNGYHKFTKNETKAFIGLGFQVFPFKTSKDALRFSVQRYLGKNDLIDANLTSIRLGYVKTF